MEDENNFGTYRSKKDVTGPVSVQTRDGWEVTKIQYYLDYYGDGDKDDIEKVIQNGDSIKLPAAIEDAEWIAQVTITLENKSLGLTQELYLFPNEDWDD